MKKRHWEGIAMFRSSRSVQCCLKAGDRCVPQSLTAIFSWKCFLVAALDLKALITCLLSVANGEANPGLAPRFLPVSSAFYDRWDMGKNTRPRAKVSCSTEGLPPALGVWCVCEVAQSCPTLCDPVDCSLPGSSVHGIFQARVLEWVATSFSRRSSPPRNRTRVSRIVGRRFTVWAALSRWHLCVPWLKTLTQNLAHHTQLCWEEKAGQAGVLFLLWSPAFQRRRAGVLGRTPRLRGAQAGLGPSRGRHSGPPRCRPLPPLATRWRPDFGVFAVSFNLPEKLVQIIAEQVQAWFGVRNLWSWLHTLSQTLRHRASDRAVLIGCRCYNRGCVSSTPFPLCPVAWGQAVTLKLAVVLDQVC